MNNKRRIFESTDEIKSKAAKAYQYRQVFLPKDEYAKVMSEFNTHMSDEERKRRFVTKAIGDYYYTIINLEFDDYVIIDKSPINTDSRHIWESRDAK